MSAVCSTSCSDNTSALPSCSASERSSTPATALRERHLPQCWGHIRLGLHLSYVLAASAKSKCRNVRAPYRIHSSWKRSLASVVAAVSHHAFMPSTQMTLLWMLTDHIVPCSTQGCLGRPQASVYNAYWHHLVCSNTSWNIHRSRPTCKQLQNDTSCPWIASWKLCSMLTQAAKRLITDSSQSDNLYQAYITYCDQTQKISQHLSVDVLASISDIAQCTRWCSATLSFLPWPVQLQKSCGAKTSLTHARKPAESKSMNCKDTSHQDVKYIQQNNQRNLH